MRTPTIEERVAELRYERYLAGLPELRPATLRRLVELREQKDLRKFLDQEGDEEAPPILLFPTLAQDYSGAEISEEYNALREGTTYCTSAERLATLRRGPAGPCDCEHCRELDASRPAPAGGFGDWLRENRATVADVGGLALMFATPTLIAAIVFFAATDRGLRVLVACLWLAFAAWCIGAALDNWGKS